ncbi:MAG: phosphohydrolase, partial [Bryobacteraceae bacterium]|nr:phosphohydrolase [Bryobacteraceae bacterium]
MKSPYVNELQPNQVVTATFLVHHKEIRQKKSGELYLSLLLGDRTGDLDAKMWDNVAEVMHTFDRDDFVRVKGLYTIYQNRPQLTIHKVQRVDDSEVDPADFFPVSARDPEQMFAELRQIVAGVRHPHLNALLSAFL